MRSRILIFAAIFLSSASISFSQSTEREISKEFYKADAQISIVINYLPKGWTFSADQDRFIIYAKDSAWMLEENNPNLVTENKDIRNQRIQKTGTRFLPKVIIRYEPKWSPDKIQIAKIKNAAINDEIRKLPEKYRIQHLLDTLKSTKSKTVYTATNEKEVKLLAQYENEVQKLLAEKAVLPDFHSEKYSLFIEKVTWVSDQTHFVYPGIASVEALTVINTFREICGK